MVLVIDQCRSWRVTELWFCLCS